MKATMGETWGSMKRMLAYTKGNRPGFLIGLVLSSSDNLMFNVGFSAVLYTVFQAIEAQDSSAIGRILAMFGLCILVFLVCTVFGAWLYRRSCAACAARFRRDVMQSTLYLPAKWYDGRHSGDTVSRLTNDVGAAEQILGAQLAAPLKAIISGVGGAIIMFGIDWRMALIALGLGVLSLWMTTRFASPVRRVSEAIQASLARVSECLSDILAAAPLVRVFNLGPWVAGRLDKASRETYKHAMSRIRWQAGQDVVTTLSGWLLFIGMILIGSVGVILGLTTFPTLVALVQVNNGIGFLFQSIGGAFTQLQASVAGANRVFELMDGEREHPTQELGAVDTAAPAIEMRDVSFAYEADQEVLCGLTETVRAGEKIALVGSSGSGKSTVLKVLLGFYGTSAGAVRIFGRDLGTNPAVLRPAVAYVPQTCYLFAGTIRDNIAAGRPGATEEEIQQAARTALAHDFILSLPQGYDTEVGERGAQLSGGQRQRIAIARAVLKDAPILLLDEATASLDSEAEAQVQAALEALMQGRTVVVVAHRLSTVRNADRILVMERGAIAERGTHEELMARESLYAQYVRAQMEGVAV